MAHRPFRICAREGVASAGEARRRKAARWRGPLIPWCPRFRALPHLVILGPPQPNLALDLRLDLKVLVVLCHSLRDAALLLEADGGGLGLCGRRLCARRRAALRQRRAAAGGARGARRRGARRAACGGAAGSARAGHGRGWAARGAGYMRRGPSAPLSLVALQQPRRGGSKVAQRWLTAGSAMSQSSDGVCAKSAGGGAATPRATKGAPRPARESQPPPVPPGAWQTEADECRACASASARTRRRRLCARAGSHGASRRQLWQGLAQAPRGARG